VLYFILRCLGRPGTGLAYQGNVECGERAWHSLPIAVEVANPNNPALDLITMKQVLVKAAELKYSKLSAEAHGLYTVSKL
jgi:hypothetical protein